MDKKRLEKLQKRLEFPFLIEHLPDLFYLTGLHLSKGRFFVGHNEAILFVDGRYFESAKKKAPCKVYLWEEQKKLKEPKIGFDGATISYETYLELKKGWPQTEWVSIKSPLKLLRAIKEEKEIAALKKGADLTRKGIERMTSLLKVGVQEEDLALEFEFFCRKNGASGLSFQPIVAFGKNSAYPHYRASKERLKENELVLFDVGAVVEGYHADLTRVIHFGKIDEDLIHFEEIVKRARQMAIDEIRPGIKVGELDQIVQNEFLKANVKQLYIHGLGHGVGLEPHEFPSVRFKGKDHDVVLEAGMVFTVEPGLYQVGLGGIRIEDMILVTERGHATL